MLRIGLIDHYDSFTDNVIAWLEHGRSKTCVERIFFDDMEGLSYLARQDIPIVLSPGPKHPEAVSSTIDFTRSILGDRPVLGICLGHQILGFIAGCRVQKTNLPRHGQEIPIHIVKGYRLWEGVPSSFNAASYNSLVVSPHPAIEVLATNRLTIRGDKYNKSHPASADAEYIEEIQALRLPTGKKWDALGLQFHPESFLTEYGVAIRENWLNMMS